MQRRPSRCAGLARIVQILVMSILPLACAQHAATTSTASSTQPSDVRFRIALVSDPHCSPEPRYAEYVKNFAEVIDGVNATPGVDVVLVAGDLAQHAQPDSFALFKRMSKLFRAPVLCVPGNHDIGNIPLPGHPGTATEAKVAAFTSAIGPAHFVDQSTLPGLRVIGIASSVLGLDTPTAQAQWAMLERELAAPHPDEVTVLLTHYPPFNSDPDEKDEYFNIGTAARHRLLDLLERGHVTAVLSGHLHRPIERSWHGIPIIGAPAVSFGLPEGQQQVGWKLVTVHRDGSIEAQLRYLDHITRQPAPLSPATTKSSSADSHAGAATSQPSHAAELLHGMRVADHIKKLGASEPYPFYKDRKGESRR